VGIKVRDLLLGMATLFSLLPVVGTAELATASAIIREAPREIRLDGVVEVVSQTTVSAQTQGQVEEVLFDVDDFVEAGQLIIRLNDKEHKAKLRQAEAVLKETQARLQEARDQHRRVKEMYTKQLASQSRMDEAVAALKSASARQESASAGLEQTEKQFEYTRIKAPYSGIVTQRFVEVGETASLGQKLMSGFSLDQLRISVDVPQSLIPTVRKLGKARFLQPGNGYVDASKLTIFPFAHQGSNTFKVRMNLPKETVNLFPGMFVKTAFTTGIKEELVVPAAAVVYRSEVTAVYVVNDDSKIGFRHVRLGHTTEDGRISVIAGLLPSEKVALDPIAAGKILKQQLREAQK